MRKALLLSLTILFFLLATIPVFAYNPRYLFTDQERDSESGLYNFDARQYNPSIGRFVQPDPFLNELNRQNDFLNQYKNQNQPQRLEELLKNPQRLNYYSYAAGNPLIYTDPTGRLQIHFNKDMTEEQKQQFLEGLKYLQDNVKDNQQVKDYFKKFDVDIVEVLGDNDKGPDVYFKKEIKTKNGKAYGQYDPRLWLNDIYISLEAIGKSIQAVGSTLIHELGHYAEDVGSIFGRLQPNFNGELGLKQNYVTLWMKYNLGMDDQYIEKIEREFGYLAEYLTFGFIF